jgi:hypothetical protein
MVATVDLTSNPWIHVSGTGAEVCAYLKLENIAQQSIAAHWSDTTDKLHVIIRIG